MILENEINNSTHSLKEAFKEAGHTIIPIEGQRHYFRNLAERLDPDIDTFDKVKMAGVITLFQAAIYAPVFGYIIDKLQ